MANGSQPASGCRWDVARIEGFECGDGLRVVPVGLAGGEPGGVVIETRFVGFGPLRFFGEEIGEGRAAAFFLCWEWDLVGSGELDEQTRSDHVAGNGFVDEGLGDAVRFLANKRVDGVAQEKAATAGRSAAFGSRGFPTPTTKLRRWGARFSAARLGRLNALATKFRRWGPRLTWFHRAFGFGLVEVRGFALHLVCPECECLLRE
jgi:hypothetical protein